ncbi:MAG TPA: M15 family metallopeptidase [Pyrinomonadaceae bacterium]|nr:M15 family metallopeptidase [Pyrinomonadaceae bacterium]
MKRTTLATTLVIVLVGYGSILRVNSPTSFASAQSVGTLHQSKPTSVPARWRGLIGEYGPDKLVPLPDDDILIIFEEGGLRALFKRGGDYYPLNEESGNVFELTDSGPRVGQTLIFTRDRRGRATQVALDAIVLKRRNIEPESGNQLRIKPVRPIAELMKEALASQPPLENGDFLNTDLVELRKLDPTIRLEVRYATTNNFLGTKFYTQARAFMQRPAAEALVRVHRNLKRQGYGLLIHDAYRPWYVTKVFWDAVPEDKKLFVADPARGSRHNRGCAVDLTLYHLKTGKPVEMVATYDETTERAHSDYPGGTSLQRWHRELLRKAMEAEDFAIFAPEWWHFDYKDWQKYRIGNQRFEEIGRRSRR